jgi:biotin carboxylase
VIGLTNQDNRTRFIQALGYRALLFTGQVTMEEMLTADAPVEIDLSDEQRVHDQALRLAQRFDIRALYSLNEYRVPLAAQIAEELSLPFSLSVEAALNCRSKKRTRQLFAAHSVPLAEFRLVRSSADALAALAEIPLPVIVKPSNEAGSAFVTRCDTPAEVVAAIAAIQRAGRNFGGQALDPDILVEEFLVGPEFSVEAVTAAGRTTVLAITAKHLLPGTTIEIGHSVPAQISADDAQAIERVVTAGLAALGVEHIVSHTEVKLTPSGPRIIEVNARPGGDYIPALVAAVTGYDLYELALHAALGHPIEAAPRHAPQTESAAVRFLYAPEEGIVSMNDPELIVGAPGLQQLHMRVAPGGYVLRTSSNYNRLGHLIAHATPERSADQVAEQALRQIDLHVWEQRAAA